MASKLDRRAAMIALAASVGACGRKGATLHHSPLDGRGLDRRFPPVADRAAPGRFGAGVMNPDNGQSWFSKSELPFPMTGFFMLPAAAAALAEVDAGRLKLGERIRITELDLSPPYSAIDLRWPSPPLHHAALMPAVDLIALAVQAGDNTAADVIMKRVGGPGAVTAWLRQVQITDMRVDRYAREIEQEMAGMASFRPEWKDEAAWLAARDTVPAAAREVAMNAYVADPRDTTTVRDAVQLLYLLAIGELLSAASSRLLLTLMTTSRTGANRLAAAIPGGAVIAQKASQTRTDLGFTPAVNDVAIVTFRDGRRAVMAGLLAGSTATQENRDRLFADSARLFTQALG